MENAVEIVNCHKHNISMLTMRILHEYQKRALVILLVYSKRDIFVNFGSTMLGQQTLHSELFK